MLKELFLFILLLQKLLHCYYCVECFDFQCYDGGHISGDNCFKCENVSSKSYNQWLSHLQQNVKVATILKKFDKARIFESRIADGMYCCKTSSTHPVCSLSLSYGSRDGQPHFGMGCLKNSIFIDAECKVGNSGRRCCNDNHCNGPNVTELQHLMDQTVLLYPQVAINSNSETLNHKITIIGIVCIICICLVGLFVFCIAKGFNSGSNAQSQNGTLYKKMHCLVKLFTFACGYKRGKNNKGGEDITSYSESMIGRKHLESNKLAAYADLTCSGSGAGKPLLTKRTAATDINLIHPVGEGRFGTVWLGKWNGDNVAVKIFSTRDERSWDREKQIYQKNFLRHSNVLGYVATDSRDNGLATELWLVTDFHENGSLYDYLRLHVLTIEQAAKMVRSVTNGLAYLHMEINGIDLRPGIAHRDLKSRNILVKSCGECCIGDLGLSVRLNEDFSALEMNRVGTRRYMAPEVILDKIVLSDQHYNGGLEAFKKADIYSYSLVLWEILRCCECPSMKVFSSPYEMPYQNLVTNDPSIDEMRDIVCDKKIRPPISQSWDNINPLREVSKSIQESWFEEPASRLSIMRLKKIMQNVWNEVLTLKSTISDISASDDNVTKSVVNGVHKQLHNPHHNHYPLSSNSTTSTEFPCSITSNDIPNIVIRTKDNVLLTDAPGITTS